MELVFTGRREAAISAFLEADEFFVPEVPAARPLIDIAADSSLVADLRGTDFSRRCHDGRIFSSDVVILCEIDDLHGRANLQSAVRRGSDCRFQRILHVHEAVRLMDVIFHPGQQILAAGNRHRHAAAF